MNKSNNKGFTLLEIIIVILIVGVLAGLALPKFYRTIEFSRSTEALNALGVIRNSVERCGLVNDDVTGCNVFTSLDVENPGLDPSAHFTYAIAIGNGPKHQYDITATRIALDGGTAGDKIVLALDPALPGGVKRTGTGAFSSIK